MFVASELTHENSASSDTSQTATDSRPTADRASVAIEPLQASGHAAARSPSLSGSRDKTRQRSEFQSLLAFALKTLARREHSTVELRRKLGAYSMGAAGRARQAEDAAMLDWPIGPSDGRSTDSATDVHIDQVIEALQLDGSLSDERFAAEFVRGRIRKGYGPIRIRMDLLERGVPDRLAEEQLTRPSEFWQQQAAEVCLRKFGGLQSSEFPHHAEGHKAEDSKDGKLDKPAKLDRETAQQRWNRCARFLSQRGFPADLIYRTLDGRLLD